MDMRGIWTRKKGRIKREKREIQEKRREHLRVRKEVKRKDVLCFIWGI